MTGSATDTDPSGEGLRRRDGGPDGGGNFRWWQTLLVLCWPILYLHSFVFPVHGVFRGIGNDFIHLYFRYKIYLLDVLASFRFPFWSPAEGAGYPFYSNPFAQAFYPLNLPLALFYRWFGYSPYAHQVFTVLGVSIFACGLFAWLRRLNGNPRAVLFATLVMSVSFKITEILRFPNAVHTAAWYPWILYAMTRILSGRTAREMVGPGALLFFFLVCLLTGGYPYYVFYSIFLVVPYLGAFFIRPLRTRLLGIPRIDWRRSIGTMILAASLAAAVCGPYLLATKRLLDQTTDRAGGNYEYSVFHRFSPEDTLGSLVYPPAAQAEGWYFFSIAALLILLLYLFRARPGDAVSGAGRENGSRSTPAGWAHPSVKLFLVGWIALISYVTYGRDSYLFNWLWRHFPGFSQLRVWGRLNIVLVPILAWLLSLAYVWLEITVSGQAVREDGTPSKRSVSLLVLILAYGAVLAAQSYFFRQRIVDPYWTSYFRHVDSLKVLFLVCGIASFLFLLLLMAISSRTRGVSGTGLWAVLAAAVLFASVEMAPVGTRTWIVGDVRWTPAGRLNVDRLDAESFAHRRISGYRTLSLERNFSVGIVPNWYFQRYNSFLARTEGEREARNLLLGVSRPQKIFFSRSIDHATVQGFLQDASRYPNAGRRLFYNGDVLRWEINAVEDGYLSFIDNWDYGWTVTVDGRPAKMNLLFGTFKSVRVPAGPHRVTFSYRPGFY